ncbi:transglutaminase family protein [Sphingomonas faeni]|uniref:transglutaminase family protein n=1 Tax=Sphingomonas faeni TaxID=185950 RepID=UPI00277E0061|nr:transglutaminase family protein [Sphingomonas faeni]MDQ0840266.1 regulator of sirC expression with transglutaminase-like and TPR domain [Sphingomonas faeni]
MDLDPRLHKYDFVNLGFLEDEDIVLDLAALQIASLDHPNHSFGTLIDLLAGMAAELARIVTPKQTAARQAMALEGTFMRRGFRGMTEPHVRSADIFRALASRQGAPLALAILYIATARRAGLTAVLLDTTTGVFIRLGSEEDEAVFAVDATGVFRPVSLAQDGQDPRVWLAPTTNRMTLVRLLENEADMVEIHGDVERAIALRSRITKVAPTHAKAWINKARVDERAGRPFQAKESLIAALETTRDSTLRRMLKSKIAYHMS